ncbi:MAG: leucine-rich repeat domain-containing protein [Leptospirales bacterium]|nr:leucine-rich repeat domain-containing protein [Leptospirales bacterium]
MYKQKNLIFWGLFTDIGGWAFFECWKLNSIVIPSTVTSIEGLAFADCNNLINIICNALNPPATHDSTFENSPIQSIIVPKDSITAYQEANVWKKFANIITSQ